MTNILKQVHETTKQLYDLLFAGDDNQGRTDLIEQITELIDQREQELSQLVKPKTPGEEAVGHDILQMNQAIEEELQRIFTDIEKDVSLTKKQKTSTKKYIDPYSGMPTSEGIYLDFKE